MTYYLSTMARNSGSTVVEHPATSILLGETNIASYYVFVQQPNAVQGTRYSLCQAIPGFLPTPGLLVDLPLQVKHRS